MPCNRCSDFHGVNHNYKENFFQQAVPVTKLQMKTSDGYDREFKVTFKQTEHINVLCTDYEYIVFAGVNLRGIVMKIKFIMKHPSSFLNIYRFGFYERFTIRFQFRYW